MSARQRDKVSREMADASESGGVPLIGFAVLAFVVAAIVRLIF